MSEENFEENELQYVEVFDDNGEILKCEIYDLIDYEEKTYALLLPVTEDENDDDSEVILMEYVEEDEDGYFKNIEDENEFNKICKYIESLEEEDE